MKYLVLAFLLIATPVHAQQIIVAPGANPVVINFPSAQTQEAPRSPQVDRVTELENEIKQLREELKAHVGDPVAPQDVVQPAETVAALATYPTSAAYRNWNMGGRSMSNQNLVNHLLTAPAHRGKFSKAYLQQLATAPNGNARLRALHSDDHDGRVRWSAVRGEASASVFTPLKTTRIVYTQSACPNGYCPRR